MIVEEGWPHGGVGANLATLITEQAFDHLDAPVQRVTGADVHMPYSKRLEQAAIPHEEHVVERRAGDPRGGDLMAEIVMPRLSDSMEEGTILQWLKQVGDEVAVGDELVEIETDKANMAYESDVAGTLTEILAAGGGDAADRELRSRWSGMRVRVRSAPAAGPVEAGTRRLRSLRPRRRPPDAAARGDASAQPGRPASGAEGAAPATQERRLSGSRRRRWPGGSPRSRASIWPSSRARGPGGGSSRADVEPAAGETGSEPLAAAAAPSQRRPSRRAGNGQGRRSSYEDLSKLQRRVARRMAESKATAPHFYLEAEIDMSARGRGPGAAQGARGPEGEVVPSFNDMVVKACALALREFPRANGAYRDGRFELYSRVNVGVAVAARDALVVPTVFDADRKGLRQIATDSRALAQRVRDGTITPPELSGGDLHRLQPRDVRDRQLRAP